MKKLATRCISVVMALIMLLSMVGIAEEAEKTQSFLTTVDAVSGFLGQFADTHVSYVADEDGCTQMTFSINQNGEALISNFFTQFGKDALTLGAEGQLMEINEQTIEEFVALVIPKLIDLVKNAEGMLPQEGEIAEETASNELLTALIEYALGDELQNDLMLLEGLLALEANRIAQIASEMGLVQISENGDIAISVTIESLLQLFANYFAQAAADETLVIALSGLELLRTLNVTGEQIQAFLAEVPAAFAEIAPLLAEEGAQGEFTFHMYAAGNADLLLNLADGSGNFVNVQADFDNTGMFSIVADAVDGDKTCHSTATNMNEEAALVSETVYTEGDVTASYQSTIGSDAAALTLTVNSGDEQLAAFDMYADNHGITASLVCPEFSANVTLSTANDGAVEFSLGIIDAEGAETSVEMKLDTEKNTASYSDMTKLASGVIASSNRMNSANGTLTMDGFDSNRLYNLVAVETENGGTVSYQYVVGKTMLTGSGTFDRTTGGDFTFKFSDASQMINLTGACELDLVNKTFALDASGMVYGQPLSAHIALDIAKSNGQLSFVFGKIEANGIITVTNENGTTTIVETMTVTNEGLLVGQYDLVETVTENEDGTIAFSYSLKSMSTDGTKLDALFQLVGTNFTLYVTYADNEDNAVVSAAGALVEIENGMAYTVNGTLTVNGETQPFSGSVGIGILEDSTMDIFFEYTLGDLPTTRYGLELFAGDNDEGASVYSASVYTNASDVKNVLAYAAVTIAQSIVDSPAHAEGVQMTGSDLMALIEGLIG